MKRYATNKISKLPILSLSLMLLLLFGSCKIKKEGRLCLNGVCKSLPPLNGKLSFVVEYPEYTELIPEQFNEIDLKNGTISLIAKKPLNLFGVVDDGNKEYNGSVTFQLKDAIDPAISSFTTEIKDGAFNIIIPEGIYRIIATPEDSDLPLLITERSISKKDVTIFLNREGSTKTFISKIVDANDNPMDEVKLRLFKQESPVSLETKSDNNGNFKIVYIDNYNPDTIVATPTKTIAIKKRLPLDLNASKINYGEIPIITDIVAQIHTGLNDDNTNIMWNFKYLNDGEFYYSDVGRKITPSLPAGEYLITAIPDQTSIFSITSERFLIPDQQIDIQLKYKIYLEGYIKLYDGIPAKSSFPYHSIDPSLMPFL